MEAARHCPGRVGQMGSVSTRGGQGRPQRERVMKPGRVQRALQDSIRQNGGWRREGVCCTQRDQPMQKLRQEKMESEERVRHCVTPRVSWGGGGHDLTMGSSPPSV